MKKFISRGIAQTIAAFSLVIIPSYVFAQVNNLCDLAKATVGYFNMAIEIIIGLSVVVFVYNIFRYFFLDREVKERATYLLWSVIGFAVIVSFWGLVNLVANTFNFSNNAPSFFGNMFGSSNSTPCESSDSSEGIPMGPQGSQNTTDTPMGPQGSQNTDSTFL